MLTEITQAHQDAANKIKEAIRPLLQTGFGTEMQGVWFANLPINEKHKNADYHFCLEFTGGTWIPPGANVVTDRGIPIAEIFDTEKAIDIMISDLKRDTIGILK